MRKKPKNSKKATGEPSPRRLLALGILPCLLSEFMERMSEVMDLGALIQNFLLSNTKKKVAYGKPQEKQRTQTKLFQEVFGYFEKV